MAKIIWTEPALSDLDRIADYIALDNEQAAERLVERVFAHVEILEKHPESGSIPIEAPDKSYRQIIEPPCRIFYSYKKKIVYIVSVFRSEQRVKKSGLRLRNKSLGKD